MGWTVEVQVVWVGAAWRALPQSSNCGTCCCDTEASPAGGCTHPETYSRASGICILQSSRTDPTGTQAWTADWSNWSPVRRACCSDVEYEEFPGTEACPALGWSSRSPGTEEWWSCWGVTSVPHLTDCPPTTCGLARKPEKRNPGFRPRNSKKNKINPSTIRTHFCRCVISVQWRGSAAEN